MVDPARLALIHAEIDGELDARQRAELSRYLLADPALRALRDQIRQLCTALDAVAEVEPPPQLRTDILAALPQNPPRRSGLARPVLKWRYAAVLAGVLLTGTIVFRVLDFGQQPAVNEMAGTLADPRSAVTLDMVQMTQGAVSGRISLIRAGTGVELALDLAASAPVDVLIASGERSLRVNGLGRMGVRGPGPTTIALPGFAGDGQAVNLTFLIDEHEVARAVLREPKGH